MRFKPDRCAHCGGPPRTFHSDFGLSLEGRMSSSETFFFCSDDCFESELNRHMPAELALGKTIGDDRQYKALVADYHDARRRCFPDGRLYSNQELEQLQKFDQEEQAVITRFEDDWATRRSDAITHGIREISDVWAAHHKQEWQQQQDQTAAEAEERRLFEELIRPRPIPDEPYRQEHTHILGPSGSGKTTLIQQLILDDLAKPNPPGMAIIDPKGLMVERLQSLAVFHPDTGRLKDRLIIIDPTHSPPPSLNMFHAASRWTKLWSEDQRRRIENQAIDTFAFVFSSTGSKLTDKQATPFSFAVRLMFNMESTIHTLVDLMDDPTRTDEKGPPLSQSRFAPFIGRLDDVSRRFFEREFFSSNYRETRQQIKARIYGMLQHPEFLKMFEARERKLDMLDCLQSRSIVLVNTGMNTMGSGASQLLGRYIIALTLNAAFARFTIPKDEWHQAHLIIDEFQEFADDEKTPELLRLAREYKLGVTLAHQEMHGAGMTDTVRSAISTNTTVKYASRPEGVDINYVARDMRCDPEFLTQQTKTATHARFACFVRGFIDHPVSLTIPFGNVDKQPQMSDAALQRLLMINSERLSAEPTSKLSVPMTTRESAPKFVDLKTPPDASDPASEW